MNLDNLTCRRIMEENHNDKIVQILEDNRLTNDARYIATISPKQVNIYDTADRYKQFSFFAHYEVEETEFFKGGECTCGCWIYPQDGFADDSVLAVGTSLGEVFLLSCVQCTVISVLTMLDPSGSPITSISVSQRHPDQLLVTEESGCIRCWTLSTKTCQFQIEDARAQAVCWESDDALVLTNPSTISLLNMTSQTLQPVPPTVIQSLSHSRITGLLGSPKLNAWLIITPLAIHRWNWSVNEVSIDSFSASHLPDVFSPARLSLSPNAKFLFVSDNFRTYVMSIEGQQIDSISDNFAETNGIRESHTYHRLPVLHSVIQEEGQYALMVEANRVLYFSQLDPDSRYVVHVKYPHPVEDMFLFYPSLNDEPLVYLNPKLNKTTVKRE